jgi:hypothetical protein
MGEEGRRKAEERNGEAVDGMGIRKRENTGVVQKERR